MGSSQFMTEIDEVRCQRDVARADNIRLRRENERLSMLLHYASEAAREEYLLRIFETEGGK